MTLARRTHPALSARRRRVLVAGVAAGCVASAALAPAAIGASTTYSFTTLDNQTDPTFNQLLGINNLGTIAGYFGSGAAGHPNKGYVLSPPYGQANYVLENFPNSVQTQVTGISDTRITVGFWSNENNANQVNPNFGFVDVAGHFRNVNDPATPASALPVNQLLGVNDRAVAAGFYVDANGNAHGYLYSILRGTFTPIDAPGATATTATGVNNLGQVSGFALEPSGATAAFFLAGGKFTVAEFPGSTNTMALGLNDVGEVVGVYTDAAGNVHGFTWLPRTATFQAVDDPNGLGTTTVNGVNDRGDLVGFYVDGNGNTDGFLAVPHGG